MQQEMKIAAGQWAGAVRTPLTGADRVILLLVGSLLLLSVGFDLLIGRRVDWGEIAFPLVFSFALLGAGLVLRRSHFQLHATGLVAFGAFSASITLNLVFALQLFPLANPPIDAALAAFDARLGHDWARFVQLMADHPRIGSLLGWVYQSFFLQMLLVVCTLTILGRSRQLCSFLIVSQVALYVTLLLWWFYPSLGPAAYVALPAEVERAVGLVYDAEKGRLLRELAANGTPLIDSSVMIGTVAFPSYHLLMACAIVWYLRGTFLFAPALLLNIPMIPATIGHGGHHLIDLIGGAVLFALLAAATGLIYDRRAGRG